MEAFCESYTRAVELIGRRWSGAILRAMLTGRSRFNDIVQAVPGLSDRLLSQRLKELEAEGIVNRTVTPSTPVCITYTLSEKGSALAPVLASLETWASTWMDADATVGPR